MKITQPCVIYREALNLPKCFLTSTQEYGETYRPKGTGHLLAQLKIELRRRLLFVTMVLYVFSIISEVNLSPTVRAKYPSSHSSPFQSLCLIDVHSQNTSRSLMLFSVPTTWLIEYRGGNERNMCTGSFAAYISSITNSYSFAISFKKRSRPLVKVFLREQLLSIVRAPCEMVLCVIVDMTC